MRRTAMAESRNPNEPSVRHRAADVLAGALTGTGFAVTGPDRIPNGQYYFLQAVASGQQKVDAAVRVYAEDYLSLFFRLDDSSTVRVLTYDSPQYVVDVLCLLRDGKNDLVPLVKQRVPRQKPVAAPAAQEPRKTLPISADMFMGGRSMDLSSISTEALAAELRSRGVKVGDQ